MRIRDIWVIEIEEFEWRKLEKASSSILLYVCVCVSNNRIDDSKEKDWERKLGKGVAELKKETEEFEWRKLEKTSSSI